MAEETTAAAPAAEAAPIPETVLTPPAPDAPPPAEQKQGEEQAGEKAPDEKPAAGAPEKYEFTAPEGTELDQALLGKFEPLFRDLNLPQEGAQKLLDAYAKEVMPTIQQAQAEAHGRMIEEWGAAVKADPEMGGKNYEATVKNALKVMERYGDPELKQLMGIASKDNPTGLGIGNHPALVRAFAKIGAAMGEDTPPPATQPGQGASDITKRMFPDFK